MNAVSEALTCPNNSDICWMDVGGKEPRDIFWLGTFSSLTWWCNILIEREQVLWIASSIVLLFSSWKFSVPRLTSSWQVQQFLYYGLQRWSHQSSPPQMHLWRIPIVLWSVLSVLYSIFDLYYYFAGTGIYVSIACVTLVLKCRCFVYILVSVLCIWFTAGLLLTGVRMCHVGWGWCQPRLIDLQRVREVLGRPPEVGAVLGSCVPLSPRTLATNLPRLKPAAWVTLSLWLGCWKWYNGLRLTVSWRNHMNHGSNYNLHSSFTYLHGMAPTLYNVCPLDICIYLFYFFYSMCCSVVHTVCSAVTEL